ncbi:MULTISPECIES: hypothetical protein [Rhizobium]|uniref:hypothetical protein n=1 Tax=Rhizobium TaxID=379 RepID=UPI00195C1325|nr:MULTISPECIES: hypothetical protein [Rhizobium]MBM7046097.1 hypothetical protein [Rhizobium lusitanum]
MSEIKHTPRPWKADSRFSQYSVHLVGADGRFIASSSWHDDSPHYPTKSQTFENFGLIARAVNCHDDLLRALKSLTEYAEGANDPDWFPEEAERIAVARAAIAKAEGRS